MFPNRTQTRLKSFKRTPSLPAGRSKRARARTLAFLNCSVGTRDPTFAPALPPRNRIFFFVGPRRWQGPSFFFLQLRAKSDDEEKLRGDSHQHQHHDDDGARTAGVRSHGGTTPERTGSRRRGHGGECEDGGGPTRGRPIRRAPGVSLLPISDLCLSLTACSFVSFQIAVTYQSIDVLQEHGINATDLQKLQTAGFHTVESVRPSHHVHGRRPAFASFSFSLLNPSLLSLFVCPPNNTRLRTRRRESCARSRGSPRPRSSSSRRSSRRWSRWTSRRRPTPSRIASPW